MNRRAFLKWAAAGMAIAAAPGVLAAPPPVGIDIWHRPESMRWLWLVRDQVKESAKIVYFKDGALTNGYVDACHLLRDIRAPAKEQVVQIDPVLLDLLFSCQEWLRLNGILVPIHVLSGYRTIRTNLNTEGAALNSMHIHGRAVDIYIPGLPIHYLQKLASWFQAGGVGFYPRRGFIHLDTGSARNWAS